MKKFLINCLIILGLLFAIGELVVRTFDLYEKPILRENKNGNYLPVSFQQGTMVKGKFKEISGKYSINNLGFNSIHNYHPNKLTNKFKIAIVGDSYVEGAHININDGIGAMLEKQLGNDYIVYEYGVSETNIADYENIYNQYNLKTFDLVFVIFSLADLYGFNPDSIGTEDKGNSLKNSLFREMYNKSYFISYLNFNHAVFRGFKASLLKKDNVKKNNDTLKLNLNTKFLDRSPMNVIAVYNRVYEDEQLNKHVDFNYLTITHDLKPYTFGFDRHWNENGRKNVVKVLKKAIKTSKNNKVY